jgi:hypothetical protein
MKTIYLHIGNFKTGTSALQKFCSDHREKLLAAGLDYPLSARPAGNRTNHSLLPLSLYQGHGKRTPEWYVDSTSFGDVARSLRSEIDASPCQRILISSEEFFRLTIFDPKSVNAMSRKMSDLFSDYNVKVIMYARPPLEFIKSWYNQANKAPVPRKRFIDFFFDLNEILMTPSVSASFWRKSFGEDALRVVPYELGGSAHIEHFLALTDTAYSPDNNEKPLDVNPGINAVTLERGRLAQIYSSVSAEDRQSYLGTQALASSENIVQLKEKIDRINTSYRTFCTTEHLPQPSRELSLEELLVAAENINRGDALTLNPSPYLKSLVKSSATIRRLAAWVKSKY